MSTPAIISSQSAKEPDPFRPHWLKGNRAPNDVTRLTHNAPLAEAIAGRSVQTHPKVLQAKRALCALETKEWIPDIQKAATALSKLGANYIESDCVPAILDAIRAGDGKAAAGMVYALLEEHFKALCQSLDGEVQHAIASLPHGDAIWQHVKNISPYGLCLENDGDGNLALTIESTDFYCHYYAAVTHVPEKLKDAYTCLLHALIQHGLGDWQLYPTLYCNGVDINTDKAGVAEIAAFIDELEASDDRKAFLKKKKLTDTITDFLADVVECFFYGESLSDFLQSEPESAFHHMHDCLNLIRYEVASNDLMKNASGVSIDAIAAWSDTDVGDCLYAQLFRQCARLVQEVAVADDVKDAIEQREETFPFGILVSPFDEVQFLDYECISQYSYEHFLNCGEDRDIQCVNLDHAQWRDAVGARLKATGVLIALIAAVTIIIPDQKSGDKPNKQ